MNGPFDYWQLLAGLALFLYAMSQLETGLRTLSGRSMAVYLKRQTGRRVNAVLGGIISTAILQSSSVVGLMALAFTGAGLLTLPAALGIVFGSNLGTTLTGWIVATLGFKLEIFELSLPLIAGGGLLYVFGRERWAEIGRTILGLGLLLLGLQFMKASVELLEQQIDIAILDGLAPWQYLLFGAVTAAVIQSSSATMLITLAALNSGIIDLGSAAAVAIGADLGTTTTVMLGAIKGSAAKKQVAAGQVIFNVVTDIIAFALRVPLLALVAALGIEDPLYSLVAFHSLFNLLGLVLFIPFTDPFAALLQRLFPERDRPTGYLQELRSGVGEAAVDAADRETSRLLTYALQLQMNVFDPALRMPGDKMPLPHRRGIRTARQLPFEQLYREAKLLEGDLLEFAVRLQAEQLNAAESARLSQLLVAAREALHSAKAVKDIRHNLVELADRERPGAGAYPDTFRRYMQEFIDTLFAVRDGDAIRVTYEDLAGLLQQVNRRHDECHQNIYADVRNDSVAESEVSSLLNVNRELLTSARAMTIALGYYYLDATAAENLEHMPL